MWYLFKGNKVKMKTLLLLVLVIVGLWQIKIPDKPVPNNSMAIKPVVSEATIQIDSVSFICDDREYCSQMTSYEEAVFFKTNCPDTKIDIGKDGMICEPQFAKSIY